MDIKKDLKNLFGNALEYCSPANAVNNEFRIRGNDCFIRDLRYDLQQHPVYLLSVGKASVKMFQSAQNLLGDHIEQSLIITSDERQARQCTGDTVITGSHPTPDKSSLRAGNAAVKFMKSLPQDALLICLISGGTSSLMCRPARGITIAELNRTYDLLNNSGATIHEINTVRKHCSLLKGGQLLRYMPKSLSLVELVISDVPHDDLSDIGSGPTTPDSSTFQDAYHILLEYGLWDRLDESVRIHIEKGINGEVDETLAPDKDPISHHHSFIISSARRLASRLGELATEKGYNVWVDQKPFTDKVEIVADTISGRLLSLQEENSHSDSPDPHLFIYYGESYVKVTGSGKGGRNQELALRGALQIEGLSNVTWMSIGTDGVDGPTDAAGAVVDGATIREARRIGLNPQKYLRRNDSYNFHQRLGTLYKTGPTGNNLMDVTIVAVQ